jgi:CHAD domain-containing protein
LFAAILADDEIDRDADLPAAVALDCRDEALRACYRLSRQLWDEGVDRAALASIVDRALWRGSLDPDERVAFKHARAKFKHLRYACSLFGAGHRYPWLFHRITAGMGQLQDALDNHQRAAATRIAAWLRVLFARAPYGWARREIDTLPPTTPAAFRAYLGQDVRHMAAELGRGDSSADEFHQLRKIVGRHVSLYCNLQVLAPSPMYAALTRYLGTINGLMGDVHDDLVTARFHGVVRDVRNRFAIPEEIEVRLGRLVRWYRRGGLMQNADPTPRREGYRR